MLTKNKLYRFIILLILWTLLGFFFVIPQYIYSVNNSQPFNWYNQLTYRVPNYMIWTFFTPLVFYIINKLRLIKEDILKNLGIITLSGIVISLVHRFISVFITFTIRRLDGQLERTIFESIGVARLGILGGSFDSFFVYGLVVSVIVSIIYYNRHRQSELSKSNLEIKLAEAKLELLKSQLQPHFLFNTLHAVSTLMHRDVKLAEKVLAKLSDLLRMSLEGLGKNIITLKEEIEFLGKYLEIQKIRFENRINIIFDIDNSLLDAVIPAFLLQPIVENSIKYCVEPSPETQTIKISATKNRQKLILEVTDSGPGINQEYQQGIGLKNTSDRLKHLFDENFDLFLTNNSDKGLTVKIKIPFNYEQNINHNN